MVQNTIGIVNFLRLCELLNEEDALQLINAVREGIITKSVIEKLIHANETKEHFEAALAKRLKIDP